MLFHSWVMFLDEQLQNESQKEYGTIFWDLKVVPVILYQAFCLWTPSLVFILDQFSTSNSSSKATLEPRFLARTGSIFFE
jgi:hypothetical protein